MAVRWQIPPRIKPSPGQSQPIQLKDGLAVDTKGRPRGTPEVVWLWRGVVFGPYLAWRCGGGKFFIAHARFLFLWWPIKL